MGECVPLLPPTQAGPLIGPASCGHLRPGLTQGQVPVLHRHGREHPGLSNRKANTALQRAKDLCKHFSKEATQRLASPQNDARRRAKPQGEHPQGGNGNPNRRAGFAQGCGDVEPCTSLVGMRNGSVAVGKYLAVPQIGPIERGAGRSGGCLWDTPSDCGLATTKTGHSPGPASGWTGSFLG